MPDDKKPSQTSYQDILSRWNEEQRNRLETSRAELTRLVSSRPEIALFTVEYSGSSDQGQVEELIAHDDMNNPLPLPQELHDAVEGLVYDLLAVHCPGWEINAGSSGLLTIDAWTLQGTIEQNWVVTEYEHHEIEF
jgi:hypothetical protein